MENRENLKAYVDGELPAAKAESIRQAAESDPEIERELEALRTVGGALKSMQMDYEVRGLNQTLMALGGARSSTRVPNSRRGTWFGFAVGVALAAAAALIYGLPQIFGESRSRSSASTVAMNDAQKQSMARVTPRSPFTHGIADGAMGRSGALSKEKMSGGVTAAPKPPPTLEDQVKTDQAQIKDLQNQVNQLKTKTPNGISENGGFSAPALPAPSAAVADPGSLGQTVLPDAGMTPRSRGLAPNRIANLESQVKKLLAAQKLSPEASGPAVMRSLVVTVDTAKAKPLVTKIQSILKGGGTVSFEDIPPPPIDEHAQMVLDRITDLKLQREKLLQDYLPEAPQVKELDTQIQTMQASIQTAKQQPKTRIHVAIG